MGYSVQPNTISSFIANSDAFNAICGDKKIPDLTLCLG